MRSVLRSVPRSVPCSVALGAVLLLPVVAGAQQPSDSGRKCPHCAQPSAAGEHQSAHHVLLEPGKLDWQPAPAVLPPGAQLAVVEGDPAKPGPFTMRVRFPDGYRIKPHFHGTDEHVTVLDGSLALGLGDQWNDDALTALPAGGFALMPAGTRHFAQARGATTIQLHGVGPWALTYVNTADDPRGTKPESARPTP